MNSKTGFTWIYSVTDYPLIRSFSSITICNRFLLIRFNPCKLLIFFQRLQMRGLHSCRHRMKITSYEFSYAKLLPSNIPAVAGRLQLLSYFHTYVYDFYFIHNQAVLLKKVFIEIILLKNIYLTETKYIFLYIKISSSILTLCVETWMRTSRTKRHESYLWLEHQTCVVFRISWVLHSAFKVTAVFYLTF